MLGILAHSLRTATRNPGTLDPDELRRRAHRDEARRLDFEFLWHSRPLGRSPVKNAQRRDRSAE